MTSASTALWAALADLYQQSWRLALLNTALSAVLAPLLLGAVWVPLLLVPAAVVAGPLLMALMHCAVTLAQTEDLSLRCAVTGLRLHWRRGVVLGLIGVLVSVPGIVGLATYGRAGAWVLAAVVLYLLVAFAAYQLTVWPLAVAEQGAPLTSVLGSAARTAMRRPFQAVLLVLALALVNLVGAAAALMPLLTLTVAFSFLAAAHFALPASHFREASD